MVDKKLKVDSEGVGDLELPGKVCRTRSCMQYKEASAKYE